MAKKSTKEGKAKKKQTFSNVIKPSGMSLVEWQTALRQQTAEKGLFKTNFNQDSVIVYNLESKNRYTAQYYGRQSELNYCDCMDFKTSRLGTCKHIEAIVLKKKKRLQTPASPVLYVDYTKERAIKLYSGSRDLEFSSIQKFFDQNGCLKPYALLDIDTVIEEAKKISKDLIVRQDVYDLAAESRDRFNRRKHLDGIFAQKNWSKDLFVDGISPYPYQIEGIMFASQSGKSIIADEMGLGKTIQAIGTAELLYKQGYISEILVICPTSLKYQWKREIEKFTGSEVLVIEGNMLQRQRQYKEQTKYKIVSYNAICNDIKSGYAFKIDMLIMDEVQRLKNWNTQIAKAIRKVHSDYSVILSGTPLENKIEELYSIVQLVDQYALGPFYEFKQNHINTDECGKTIGYCNLNEISQMLKPIMIRRNKKDVALQLPDRIDQNIFVPMTPKQREVHNDFKESVARLVRKWRRMHFLSETDRRRLLLMLSQMRMVCDSTYILDQESRNDTKVEEAMNLVQEILDNGNDKIVIFSQWERMTRLIAMELDKAGIQYSYLHGGVPSEKRKRLTDDFIDDDNVKVFLSTDAGGVGLNLQSGSYIINLDLPWNPAVLEQRIARVHRLGQNKTVHVINLVSNNSIEEQMIGKLKFKSSMAEGVLDDGANVVWLSENSMQDIVENFDFDEQDTSIQEEFEEAEKVEGLQESPLLEQDQDEPEDYVSSSNTQAESQETSQNWTSGIPVSSSDNPSEVHTGIDSDGDSPMVDPSDIISLGGAFFKSLANTISSPRKTSELLDKLVKVDKESGKTSINIPVPSRNAVEDFLTAFRKLIDK